jgi:hypothetical protein
MGIHLLAIQNVALFFEDNQGAKLIRPDFIETNPDPQLQCRPKIQRPADQKPGLGKLCRVDPVEGTAAAAAAVFWCIRTETGIAQILAPERPVDKESQGGPFGPLPVRQFGPAPSWKPASRASMAAFTATA